MDFTAVLFPGQGSLTADARDHARDVVPDLVQRASELVGEDPFDRPHDSTRFAQPAIFVASMAGWRERQDDLSDVGAMAGHSLGELSALAAAGALRLDDALKLVVLRGRLMADAAEENPGGGMVALLGATPERAAALAAAHGLELANDNAPGQVVLSGRRVAIDVVTKAARAEGLKAMALDLAGAFHSRDMAAAELPFLLALEDVPMSRPHVPVVSGYAARPFAEVPFELARALVSPVRWRETMAMLVELGARRFVDVGPGEVLARLVKRNVRIEQGDVVLV
ncbi:MAG: ACP S-malonyltransferase [Actinobacteria bacterium]|nr:MAG: ACP S-malonyltransferase [Actinomycetota bacterium]